MEIKITQNAGELIKASGNYLNDLECYEVEIIKNDFPADTKYRIEMIDNDYINVTRSELKGLQRLLTDKEVCSLLGITENKQRKKETVLKSIEKANPQKLKDYLYDMINSLEEDDFIEGHDNGYNDGYGTLQDIYINKLLIDCTLLNKEG